mgnify:CR=1 FL=1|tara:strand:- start:6612 stop:8447 length:1836 start_codon:yes stop_codon:yes gene_type:complete
MIGIVEIYKHYGTESQKLLHTEQNLIVDGAGEVIIDVLTTPSSIVSSVSGMNDTSNYTVQAISFGKAASAYTKYGHFWQPDGIADTSSLIARVTDDGIIRVLGSTSSYTAPADERIMPSYPNPVDLVLERGTHTAIDLSGGGFTHDEAGMLTAGKYHEVGHNLNVLPFDSEASSVFRGCWPVSGTGSKYAIVSSLTYDFVNDPDGSGAQIYPNVQDSLAGTSAGVFGGPAGGGYNNAGAMDMSGFVKAYNLCLGELGGISPTLHAGMGSGLLVSAQIGVDEHTAFGVSAGHNLNHIVGKERPIDNCEVIYVTKIASGDLGYSNLFGGISTLGLWTIDLEKTLDGLSSTSHTETDNLLYYADGTTASGNPYHFNPAYGWIKTGGAFVVDPVSGNQRDPYGGHSWQAFAAAGANTSSVAKVTFPTLTTSGDYTFSVYFQGYQDTDTSNVGLHMTAMTSATDRHYGFPVSGGGALGQRGSVSSVAVGSVQDDVLNNWTRVSHTARFPDGTSAINCHIVLSSLGWGVDNTFYDSGKYVALAHAKLEKNPTATDFVAGNEEYPPFRFKQDNNPLRYKLFAKRTLTKTLTAIKDKDADEPGSAAYQDLTLVWRIKFI